MSEITKLFWIQGWERMDVREWRWTSWSMMMSGEGRC